MNGKKKIDKYDKNEKRSLNHQSTVTVINFEIHLVSYVLRLNSISVGCAKE